MEMGYEDGWKSFRMYQIVKSVISGIEHSDCATVTSDNRKHLKTGVEVLPQNIIHTALKRAQIIGSIHHRNLTDVTK
jgi:hypothetical protein